MLNLKNRLALLPQGVYKARSNPPAPDTTKDRAIFKQDVFSERGHCSTEISQQSSSLGLSSRLCGCDHILLRSPEPVLEGYSMFYTLQDF